MRCLHVISDEIWWKLWPVVCEFNEIFFGKISKERLIAQFIILRFEIIKILKIAFKINNLRKNWKLSDKSWILWRLLKLNWR